MAENTQAPKVRKAFVTGWPIKHSRSPLIHDYWLRRYGLEGSYQKVACTEQEFPKWLSDLDRGSVDPAGSDIDWWHESKAD